MATEFDPRRNIPPPERAELTPEEKARQKIVDYLKDAELESPRFQAFSDWIDIQNACAEQMRTNDNSKLEEVRERIGQKSRRVEGYGEESRKIPFVLADYWDELSPELTDRFVRAYNYNHRVKYVHGLMEIKNQEIARKSQQSSTPPNK